MEFIATDTCQFYQCHYLYQSGIPPAARTGCLISRALRNLNAAVPAVLRGWDIPTGRREVGGPASENICAALNWFQTSESRSPGERPANGVMGTPAAGVLALAILAFSFERRFSLVGMEVSISAIVAVSSLTESPMSPSSSSVLIGIGVHCIESHEYVDNKFEEVSTFLAWFMSYAAWVVVSSSESGSDSSIGRSLLPSTGTGSSAVKSMEIPSIFGFNEHLGDFSCLCDRERRRSCSSLFCQS